MSTQITIRLRDDLVEFLDTQVATGARKSRAAAVSSAVERERRREAAMRDAAILIEKRNVDLDELATFAADQRLDID